MRLLLLMGAATLYGLITGWSFRRYTNRATLRQAVNRVIAHVLEFRLFIDEPRLIFRAQKDLLRANFALLRAIALPILIASALLAAAWLPLSSSLGKAPLQAGDVTIAKVASVADGLDLVAPFGVAVETPALRIAEESVTLWRIKALSPVNGQFRTLPQSHSVVIEYLPATYFGMPWWVVFGVVSAIASAIAISRKSGQLRRSAQ